MALDVTVGGVDSNSYIDVMDADIYAMERGYKSWNNLDNSAKVAALINSAQYIDDTYGNRFVGKRTTQKQNLCFPRIINQQLEAQSVSDNEIPKRIKYAQIELALSYIENDNSFFGGIDNIGVKSYSNTVGTIMESKTFSSSSNGFETFNARANKFLYPFLNNSLAVKRC
ncbi:MAG: hypothetical protein RSF81_08395 [Oscillospiraceae bacterium]